MHQLTNLIITTCVNCGTVSFILCLASTLWYKSLCIQKEIFKLTNNTQLTDIFISSKQQHRKVPKFTDALLCRFFSLLRLCHKHGNVFLYSHLFCLKNCYFLFEDMVIPGSRNLALMGSGKV